MHPPVNWRQKLLIWLPLSWTAGAVRSAAYCGSEAFHLLCILHASTLVPSAQERRWFENPQRKRKSCERYGVCSNSVLTVFTRVLCDFGRVDGGGGTQCCALEYRARQHTLRPCERVIPLWRAHFVPQKKDTRHV